ncbi:crotonase [Desulfuromonas versatilis]|uniref:Crotonase n=1 Tax=Desulfuromonas versatilis TaxID=2802975 RepID=A0ABN6DTA6_9BACT|nr:enoyl-CoA hydratase-related protein [Desulfuromonas versatilis]BCR02977.1 crotonase [Desulfuromonas versatilis]
MSRYANLLLETAGGIATLTLNRPKVLNALDEATLRELGEAVAALESDPEVRVIILTGAGEKAFAAGGDLAAVVDFGPLQARAFARLAQGVLGAIEGCAKPVIAAVNGYAVGGGCELAMACDIRLAGSNARFGQPEVNLGILAGWAGTQRLPRLVGKGRALELLLTGDLIDAAEALRIGLVNRVTAPQELLAAARELAEKIAAKPQTAVRLTREAVRNGLEMDGARAEHYEAELFALCFASGDQKEGMRAFLEKRKPRFRDR